MRQTRFLENCRCYHLICRLYPPAVRLLAKRGAMRGAHQAFFLDDDEKTRAAVSPRRSGATRRRDAAMPSCTPTATGERFALATRNRCARRWAMCWPSARRRAAALRKAVGIRSSLHFNRFYLSPLLERGIIARTDPDHPQSPQQRYCLT